MRRDVASTFPFLKAETGYCRPEDFLAVCYFVCFYLFVLDGTCSPATHKATNTT